MATCPSTLWYVCARVRVAPSATLSSVGGGRLLWRNQIGLEWCCSGSADSCWLTTDDGCPHPGKHFELLWDQERQDDVNKIRDACRDRDNAGGSATASFMEPETEIHAAIDCSGAGLQRPVTGLFYNGELYHRVSPLSSADVGACFGVFTCP